MEKIPLPDKKYSIIYADPPWSYNDKRGNSPGWNGITYPTMTQEQLAQMPVKEIAEKDCVLFIWVTMPLLKEGLETIENWGFKYVTCGFTWVKLNKKSPTYYKGLGHWTHPNAELCLIARRGKPKRINKTVSQIIASPVGRHSAKPKEVADKIVELMGDKSRIELFARDAKPGWDNWGNEI